MTTIAAAKQKGRLLQQRVRDAILERFPALTLDDVRSCPMGSQGEDIQLSAIAKQQLGVSIECKARKSGLTTLYQWFTEQAVRDDRQGVLIVKQDRCKPLALVDAEFLLDLLAQRSR